jgi:hypothetical protein
MDSIKTWVVASMIALAPAPAAAQADGDGAVTRNSGRDGARIETTTRVLSPQPPAAQRGGPSSGTATWVVGPPAVGPAGDEATRWPVPFSVGPEDGLAGR